MRKLLRANFFRLRKDKTFWLVTLFMFGFGIFITCVRYSAILRYQESAPFDSTLLVYVAFIGCCSAIFSSLFFGTEYSDGTIRNKLIVGHFRSSIYLSSWITNMMVSVMMIVAFLASYCALGAFLLEAPVAPLSAMLTLICISILTAIVYASIFHMIAMLVTKKSTSAVLCLLVFIGLLIMATVIKGKLDAPEFISSYTLTANGVQLSEPTPNPKYLQPAARKVYQFFLDVLPTGQSIQLSAFSVVHPYWMALYSAVISVVTTVLGVFAFRKKNLK